MELSLDDDDVPGRLLEDKLEYEEGYHHHRLQMNASDAILHRVSPETKAWLNGGPRPQRHVHVSLASRPYRMRGTSQSIEAQDAFSSQPSSPRASSSQALPPRVLQWRGGLDRLDLVAIEDFDSDLEYNFECKTCTTCTCCIFAFPMTKFYTFTWFFTLNYIWRFIVKLYNYGMRTIFKNYILVKMHDNNVNGI